MIKTYPSMKMLSLAALMALGLSACGAKDDERTAGQKLDGAIATAEQKSEAAKAEASKEAGDAKQAMKEVAQDAKDASKKAADKVTDAVADAAITTRINAELARDPQLSALKINVDTLQGRVALKGKAPNAAARERATSLAASVSGVSSVDNQLAIDPKT
ncbi:MAG: BON domain-containing protein [Burkholderiaceae bacterium]|nr:BON domain-containing protein [Burkholderiaceae bacterium]MBT9502148.1 BON domain-containing protein [Burkholderiaceae bacterium]